MSDDGFELAVVKSEGATPDLLVWRRYKRPAPGILERLLEANPQIGPDLAKGPFLSIGQVVRIPIDRDILEGRPAAQQVVKLYGEV